MTIEERAKEYADIHKATEFNYFGVGKVYGYERIYNAEITAYERGAKEQKAIDDEKLSRFKSSLEREAQINHNDENNYKQGFHDAIEKACNIFCHTGCPHKTDSYNCLNNKCDTWKIFKRMMEE